MSEVNNLNTQNRSSDTLLATVKRTLNRLLRLWLVFLIVGIVSGILGIMYASSKKPQYESRATFALDDAEGSGIGNLLNLASQFGFSVGGGKSLFAGDNIIEILKSRRLIEDVLLEVDTFNGRPYTLIQYFQEHTSKDEKKPEVSFPAGISRSDFTPDQDSVLYSFYKRFSKNLILADRPNKKLGIYEVKVTTPNEGFSKVFTDKLLDAANVLYTEIRTKKARQTLQILEERAAAMKGSLDKSISDRATVQDVNVNPAFEKANVPVIKQQSNIQVYGAAYGELFKNLEIARFQYLNEIPIMQIIDAPEYPLEVKKLGKIKSAVVFIFLAELAVLLFLGFKYVFED